MKLLKGWARGVFDSGKDECFSCSSAAREISATPAFPLRETAILLHWAARALPRTLGIVLAALSLSPFFLMGCAVFHPHSQQTQAPPLQTGPGQLNQEEANAHQPPPPSSLPQPAAEHTPPQLPPVKQPKVKHPKKRKPTETTPAQQQGAQQAAAGSVPASPIGQLTTGNGATGDQSKRDTSASLHQTAQGLDNIKRALSPDERTTVALIRTYLKQAQQALDNGDPDGAATFATKAKALLDELTPK
ncbi:MAG TPA: hypothetical protein VHX11_03420 [Acidobacteriaceae bacterium]|nr:hypothetical protein [Acidobacteriaceae bacterium]